MGKEGQNRGRKSRVFLVGGVGGGRVGRAVFAAPGAGGRLAAGRRRTRWLRVARRRTVLLRRWMFGAAASRRPRRPLLRPVAGAAGAEEAPREACSPSPAGPCPMALAEREERPRPPCLGSACARCGC